MKYVNLRDSDWPKSLKMLPGWMRGLNLDLLGVSLEPIHCPGCWYMRYLTFGSGKGVENKNLMLSSGYSSGILSK